MPYTAQGAVHDGELSRLPTRTDVFGLLVPYILKDLIVPGRWTLRLVQTKTIGFGICMSCVFGVER